MSTQEPLREITAGGFHSGCPGELASQERSPILSIYVMQVADLDDVKVKSVCCGWRHSCAIDDQGIIYTFGWSKYGQLGHGDNQ
jgi:alpha-tubulin suppressor-like RCC1 family protein